MLHYIKDKTQTKSKPQKQIKMRQQLTALSAVREDDVVINPYNWSSQDANSWHMDTNCSDHLSVNTGFSKTEYNVFTINSEKPKFFTTTEFWWWTPLL